jgi:hypothetical protein
MVTLEHLPIAGPRNQVHNRIVFEIHLKQAMQILHHRDAQSFVEKLVNKFPELSGIKLTVIASMAQKHFISGE